MAMVNSLSSFKAFRRLGLALSAASLPALSLALGVGARGSERAAAPPSALTVNGRSAPVDLDVAPRFGWQGRAIEQSAYELRVASSRAAAEDGAADVWSSGKVSSSEQLAIRYEGQPLDPSERYFWSVRTWSDGDAASAWSPVAAFGTGPGTSWSHSVPIWATAASTGWSDYALEAEVVIDEVALGIRFRASSPSDGYMWQLRGTDNRLVPHRIVDGAFTVLESVSLPPDTLALGRPARIRIDAHGSTIDTFIDGVLVHTLQDATFSSGGVGVRTGNSESGTVRSLSLLDPSGGVLLQTDFDAGDRTFGCGRAQGGALEVPRASHCLQSGLALDWVFLRKEFTPRDVPIAWATAFATGSSHLPARQYVYKLYLDGHFVGLGPTHSLASEARYDGFDVTERLEPGRPSALGVNALSYRAYRDMAEIASAVAEENDAILFDQRADALREAINTRLYLPEAGRYDDGMDGSGAPTGHSSLHASAFALAFGVPEAAEVPRVADSLAARGMACSVYCAPFLTSGLYRAGRDRAALDLLSSTSLTSWMNMIRLGAGATAEAWDPSLYVDDAPVPVEPHDGLASAPELGAGCHVLSPEADRAALQDETLLGVCSSAPVLAGEEPPHDPPGHAGAWPACSALPWLRP